MNKERAYLNAASKNLEIVLEYLDIADKQISRAFDGDHPGYPYADSVDAMAWDYVDAIRIAHREIGNRLNTWNNGNHWEG